MGESPGDEQNAKWKRLFNTVADRQNRQQDGRPLVRLISEVMAPVRFSSQADLNATRALVNERLLLSGYQVLEDGKVGRARRAATLAEAQQRADDLRAELSRRCVHPDVLRFCRAELLQQNYFHAVLEASKSVADKQAAEKLQRHVGSLHHMLLPWALRSAAPEGADHAKWAAELEQAIRALYTGSEENAYSRRR